MPAVGFQSYLANAQRIVLQDVNVPRNGGMRSADCALGLKGRTITVVRGNAASLEVTRARNDFIESFVEQFGEGCRALAEEVLLGANATPLTARVIIDLNAKAIALKPSDLTASLSDLLRRAAQADAKGVTHEQFHSLMQSRPELRADLAPLNTLRLQAEEALLRLGAFTGEEIAAAFRPGVAATAEEQEVRDTIRMLVGRALEKYNEFADGLRLVYNKRGDPTGDLFNMIIRSNNRADEVQRLVIELSNLDSESDDSRLEMYAAELLPRLALEMHGAIRTLESLRASLQPLALRFDAIRAAALRDGHVGLEEVALLLREISVAREALKDAATRGFKTPGGEFLRTDPGLLREIDNLLNKLQADVHKFTVNALEEKANNWVRGTVPSFPATKLFTVYNEVVKDIADDPVEMERFMHEMEAFRTAAIVWARGMASVAAITALNESFQHLNACMKTFRLTSEAVKLIQTARPGGDKGEERSERIEELKDKVAELKARFLKLDEQTRRELADAADADREELDKMQRLLEDGPDVLTGALRIQRLFDLLAERRKENEVDE